MKPRLIDPSLEQILSFCGREPVERVFLEDIARRGLGRFRALATQGELTALCHAPLPLVTQAFEYLTQGGVTNLLNLLRCLSDNLLLTGLGYEPPTPLPRDGLYHPDAPDGLTLEDWSARFARP